ncbi:MAG: NADH-quinone oxidoreductase subunit NuoG [Gammaproteobacteria bacterium]|nr:NADH-quinone oxidoreductase subunit NuoG [Gammaproteobacteria bacterium]
MVTIEIDGKKVQARDGAMVIEAADEAGIYIPRFCYHKKLSVAANCRMCLVEVEKARKPLPACATPVTEGMKVATRSPVALMAQKGVMEFLLINHPLDCPICDQGGECELQDVAMGYGRSESRYGEDKRVVKDKNIGPLIATEMTRCIHCTRCVRFGQEIAGIREMGATGRGEHTQIGTYIERSVDSEMSGNIIDLCPVGALTSKPFRFSARAWEMQQRDGIAGHDCVGSNIHLHVRRGKVLRVAPRDNESINECWISDRDRFSYEGLYSDDRLNAPMIKENGIWRAVDWETALTFTANGLKKVVKTHGAQQVGVLASPNATLEELFLLQKWARGLGITNIDHRLRQMDFTGQEDSPILPGMPAAIAALETADAVLLVGSNIRKEQPILAHRLRKAALRGARVSAINAMEYHYPFPTQHCVNIHPIGMVHVLAGVAKAVAKLVKGADAEGFDALVKEIKVDETAREIAENLLQGERKFVLLGAPAVAHPAYSTLLQLANFIATHTGAQFGVLLEGANGIGARMAGAIPHRGVAGKMMEKAGLDAMTMMSARLKAYVLLGVEPEFDCAHPGNATGAMTEAEFVIALTAYRTPHFDNYASVMLPIAQSMESSGTYINLEGEWQSFQGAVAPPGEARPAWKILRVLGDSCGLSGFDYMAADEVLAEIRAASFAVTPSTTMAWRCPETLGLPQAQLTRVGDVPIYAVDALVRRAASLQRTKDAIVVGAYLHPVFAKRSNLVEGNNVTARQGEAKAVLPVIYDERVPEACVYIPAALNGAETLGFAYGSVELTPA